jgi:hypothetical protein
MNENDELNLAILTELGHWLQNHPKLRNFITTKRDSHFHHLTIKATERDSHSHFHHLTIKATDNHLPVATINHNGTSLLVLNWLNHQSLLLPMADPTCFDTLVEFIIEQTT